MTPLERPSKESSCDNKQRFGKAAAKRLARVRSQEYNEDMHAYPCNYCGKWHIGHRFIKKPS